MTAIKKSVPMARVAAITATLALAMTLTACGQDNEERASKPETVTVVPELGFTPYISNKDGVYACNGDNNTVPILLQNDGSIAHNGNLISTEFTDSTVTVKFDNPGTMTGLIINDAAAAMISDVAKTAKIVVIKVADWSRVGQINSITLCQTGL